MYARNEQESCKSIGGTYLDRCRSLSDARNAQSAGVSNPQLNRYVNGRAKISLIIVPGWQNPEFLIIWLARDGAIYANVETPNKEQTIRLIRHFSNQVDEILAADGLSIKLRKRQDLMRTIYDMDSKR